MRKHRNKPRRGSGCSQHAAEHCPPGRNQKQQDFRQAEVHSVLGIINWGVDSEATGVNFGASAANGAGALNAFSALIPNGASVAKNGAVYNACVTNKADLLLAPQYVIKTKNYFVYKVIECKVTGFPGSVKSVKVAK